MIQGHVGGHVAGGSGLGDVDEELPAYTLIHS